MVVLENVVKFQSLEIRWILTISMHMQVNILRYINKLIIYSLLGHGQCAHATVNHVTEELQLNWA